MTGPTARRVGLAGLSLAALLLSAATQAQWSAVPSSVTTGSGQVAVVQNDEGAELRIWLDADAYLRAAFRLSRGLVMLDPKGCPTFQIDGEPPENMATPAHECEVSGDRASVVLARAGDGKVDSPTLLKLMNGSRLRVRYRLTHAGYGAASFSLRGSKQALSTALGDGTSVVGE